LIVLTWLALIVFSSSGYGFAARLAPVEAPQLQSAEPNVVEVPGVPVLQKERKTPPPKAQSTEPGVVEAACELISQGKFDAAAELIESVPSQYNTNLHRLLELVYEYRAMNQWRQAAREAAYRRQLARLEEFRVAPDSNDANDVSNITKVLSVIAQASEFADEKQKEQLLSDTFVKGTFQEAIDKAAQFESKGKWLDAYITCYSWLQSIEPDNQQYSDYAEQLIEKANIVASFKSSPCETCEERYEKVEKQMFVLAIRALSFNYVNIIDYRQMAAKAVRRCEMLAKVMASSSVADSGDQTLVSPGEGSEDSFSPPDSKKLSAWSAALTAILDEVKRYPTGISRDKFIDIFEKVLALNTTTVQLPTTVLIAQFAGAALSTLDPYTVMVWPRQAKDFEKSMTNEFTGIGIEITKQKGLLTVASLLPDTPAYNSGLDADDVIEAVDGVETKDMSLTCAVRKITGPAGTEVALTIRRPGEHETRDISITRARIIVPTIRGWQRTETGRWLYTIDDENKIGYVRITAFSATTASDLEDVLNELEANGLRALIVDLRFNSGGLLDSAVAVTDKFVEEGTIVRTQPGYGRLPTYAAAHKDKTHPNYPLVVLINRFSASASEIVAGALQDKMYKRAVLVGERTVGKGSVQGITSYPGGGAQLKYTMAYYHLPSGQRVENQQALKKQDRKDWGVGPDAEIKLRSDELKKMLDTQRDNDVLIQADAAGRHTSLKKHTVEENLEADPQLAVGVLLVKSKLVQEEAKNIKLNAVEL